MAVSDRNMRIEKPLLTVEEQIEHLKSKGVTFVLCSESEAAQYLFLANNYLRVTAYRKLYPCRENGAAPGTYINLDFQDLIELSSIDRRFREVLLAATIDIEHFAKIRFLQRCENLGEDGYTIVADYLASISPSQRSRIEGSFKARAGFPPRDEYSGNLIAHYAGQYPVWVFLEVVEFGILTDLWRYSAGRWGIQSMRDEHYVLKSVKSLRNACAHNSLIINGFTSRAGHVDFQCRVLWQPL